MLKKLRESTLVHILLLGGVAFITFLPTFEMFFYLDEFGSLYDFTHGDFKGVTSFTMKMFYLLYRLFGLNATGYFVAGTLVFVLSVIIFYFFARTLLKNKLLGLVAGLVYAASPVGTNTVFMIWTFIAEGGYPLTIGLLILLWGLLKYFRGGKLIYFLFVVVGYMWFVELEPRRAFLYLPILIIFDYLFNFKRIVPRVAFIARTVALFAVFVLYYKYIVVLSNIISTGRIVFSDSGATFDSQTKFKFIFESLVHSGPMITLTNIVLGAPWMFISERLVGYVKLAEIKEMYLVVVPTLSLVIILIILAWRTKREWGLMLLFSLCWIYSNILGIYVFSSPGVSEVNHRTLSLAAPGYALFATLSGATLYTFFKKKKFQPKRLNKMFVLALFVFLAVSLIGTRYNFEKFNNFRSRPAHAFFDDLKRFYPTLPANSLLYIETSRNAQVKNRLGKIYGGSNYGAGATIAVFYPERTMKEIDVVRDFSVVEKFVKDDPQRIEHVFAFYFDEKGTLSNRTSEVRTSLMEK